jgi:hypothetical protein
MSSLNTKTSCNNCIRKIIQIVSNIISFWNKSSSLVKKTSSHHIVIGKIIFQGELGNVEPNVLDSKT